MKNNEKAAQFELYKIIDWEVSADRLRGGILKLYFGDIDCEEYTGDDWNDRPYQLNAGPVYKEFTKKILYIIFNPELYSLDDAHELYDIDMSKNAIKNSENKLICRARYYQDAANSILYHLGDCVSFPNDAVKEYYKLIGFENTCHAEFL